MKITIINTVKFLLILKYLGGQYLSLSSNLIWKISYIIWDVFAQGVSDLLGSAPFCTSIVLFNSIGILDTIPHNDHNGRIRIPSRLASCPGCLYAASLTLAPVNTHYVMYVTVEVSDVVSGKTEVLITKVNFSTVLLQSAHCVCTFVYAYVWWYTHVSSVGRC